ncbi:hypothetical protein Tco_1277857 [Tanacetum coccineum]
MHEAIKTAVQLQSDRLRDEAQAKNEDFINKLDDNIKKIIKDQLKESVKAQVSKILPKVEKNVNEQLEVEVLTRLSNESKTSHAIAANLSELELKNIFIDMMEKEPMHTIKDLEEPAHQEFVTGDTEDKPDEETSQLPDCTLAQKEDTRESFNELMDTPLDFSAFVMNRLKVDTLTPELLAGPTFELMKGSRKSLVNNIHMICASHYHCLQVIPFDRFINNDFEYLSGGVSSRTYITSVTKTKATDYGHIKWIKDLVPNIMWSQVPNLDWITVHRDDDKLYTFKEGDFNRLCIQDIEDMLLLLVQGKLTNLTVKECLAFNISLQMFTRSVVIQRRVEDLQLGVESYEKKLNLIKPDTYISDLKRRKDYTSYSNPRGFIYQNKDKKNRLMRIDELHKFSDGTLNDVQTALNDHLKGIRMKYLPQTIWRQSDRDNAGAMIQAIDKQLKTMRIMRSLEKFIGGRPYEGDFRLLQRTI